MNGIILLDVSMGVISMEYQAPVKYNFHIEMGSLAHNSNLIQNTYIMISIHYFLCPLEDKVRGPLWGHSS